MENTEPFFTATKDTFEQFPTFGIPPKISLYVPFGWVPFIITTGGTAEFGAFKGDKFGAFITHFVLGGKCDEDATVLAEVHAGVVKGLAAKQKAMMAFESDLKSWVKEFNPSAACKST